MALQAELPPAVEAHTALAAKAPSSQPSLAWPSAELKEEAAANSILMSKLFNRRKLKRNSAKIILKLGSAFNRKLKT